MGTARPNATHRLLAELEDSGRIDAVITQNVDGLHTAAGQRRVVDLHGRVDRVICLGCRTTSERSVLQDRLAELNPAFGADNLQVLPDGDVAFEATAGFVLADCTRCGGDLKPDVVFFGENVPEDRVVECKQLVDRAEALVVLGSSLHVFSGRRFVKQAHQRGIPIVIVNRGCGPMTWQPSRSTVWPRRDAGRLRADYSPSDGDRGPASACAVGHPFLVSGGALRIRRRFETVRAIAR
jgi:NAD-dependent SIR2 family protein deacetylase